jgi:hypothetical protein
VTLVSAAVVGATVLTYEMRARAFLSGVRVEAIERLPKREYDALIRRYNECLEAYAWSLSVADAQRERNDLERQVVEHRLPKPPVEDAQLLLALAAAQDVRDLVRQPALAAQAEDVFRRLSRQRGEVENAHINRAFELARDGSPDALDRIRQMTHELALQAVRKLAEHETPPVRAAAVHALEANGSDAAIETLITRLAVEPDGTVKATVVALLKRATDQDFAEDHNRWNEWLRRRMAANMPGRVPPLIAEIEVPRHGEPGRPVEVRYRLRASAAVEFTYVPELDVTGAKNQRVVFQGGPAPHARRVQLRADEFVGGRCEIVLPEPGVHLVAWTARVNWGGAGEVAVRALPQTLELAPRK